MTLKRWLPVWALLVCACPPKPPPVPPAPPGPSDCRAVCAHEADLGCEAAKPTAGGASCEAICENVQRSSIIHWDLDCRARAASCAAIDRCETR